MERTRMTHLGPREQTLEQIVSLLERVVKPKALDTVDFEGLFQSLDFNNSKQVNLEEFLTKFGLTPSWDGFLSVERKSPSHLTLVQFFRDFPQILGIR